MVQKFGSNKTIGALKVRGKVAEISFEAKFLRKAMKSQEIRRNSLVLLLHNTVYPDESYKILLLCKWHEFVVELTHCEMTAEGIIAGNSKLANYRLEDAWECLRRESKERNFALIIEVIYQTEGIFARKFKVSFRYEQIVV